MIATEDLHWLAGLVEGEGCFTSEGGRLGLRPMFVLNMTDLDVVRRARSIAHIGVIYKMTTPAHCKQQWRWKVHRQSDAAGLAMMLYPLMGKRRKARIRQLLVAWKSNPPRGGKIKKGKPKKG